MNLFFNNLQLNNMKKALIFLLVTLSLQTSSAKAFVLDDFSGSKINLQEKLGQGKWTLVMFWAHHCGVCKAEMPEISEFSNKRKDVEVIGVSIDGEAKKTLAEAFIDASKPSFKSYLSELPSVAMNYESLTEESFKGTPTFLLFSPSGELIGNNPGKVSIESLEKFIAKNTPTS